MKLVPEQDHKEIYTTTLVMLTIIYTIYIFFHGLMLCSEEGRGSHADYLKSLPTQGVVKKKGKRGKEKKKEEKRRRRRERNPIGKR